MARDEIVKKLDKFLIDHNPMIEECQIVYLMVEMRKVIDHEKSSSTYPLLKFYGDWTVHTEKDHITTEIKQMMTMMYQTAEADIKNPAFRKAGSPIMQFAYMEGLSQEMKSFLEDHGIDSYLATEENKWLEFVKLLVKVLENQPITAPTPDIEFFIFEPANEGCVIGVLKFKQAIGK
jgi:hypothetical protein